MSQSLYLLNLPFYPNSKNCIDNRISNTFMLSKYELYTGYFIIYLCFFIPSKLIALNMTDLNK
jgi:hypothetical protein